MRKSGGRAAALQKCKERPASLAPSGQAEGGAYTSKMRQGRIDAMAATSSLLDTLPSIDPSTGKVLQSFERTSPLAIPQLLARARVAQQSWAKRRVAERCAQVAVLKTKILEARDLLADAVVRESGKPRAEAKFADVFVSLDSADYFAKHGASLLKPEPVKHHSLSAKAKSGKLFYEPLGVVAIISSWNYPLAIPMGQIIAAVGAGNAVRCQTSDFTPECGEVIGKLFREGGFPVGLGSVVQGGGGGWEGVT